MAGAGGRRNTSRGVKDKNAAADRARLIKDLRDHYRKLQKKHGGGNVGLNFSMKKKSGYAGLYQPKKKGKRAQITIVLPHAQGYANAYNAKIKSPKIKRRSVLAAGKRILDHEMAHHRDVITRAGHKLKPKKIIPILGITIQKGDDGHGPKFRERSREVNPEAFSGESPPHRKSKPKKILGRNRRMFGQA